MKHIYSFLLLCTLALLIVASGCSSESNTQEDAKAAPADPAEAVTPPAFPDKDGDDENAVDDTSDTVAADTDNTSESDTESDDSTVQTGVTIGEPESAEEGVEGTDDMEKEMEAKVAEMADEVVEMHDDMPPAANLLLSGDFEAARYDVSGTASIVDVDGKKMLRFDNFKTDNGPALKIYLSSDTTTDDFVDLGDIKATMGEVNYDLPDDIDLDTYNTVLVYCKPFKVLFGYAGLE